MGTTQTSGSGTERPADAGRIIMDSDIDTKETLAGNRVRVTLKSGEVVVGKVLPDGRVIRGAD